jgi:hypothetical protein
MKFTQANYDGTYNILANDHFVAKPIVVDVSGGSTVKAGTPLSADGKAAVTSGTPSASNAVGVLLYDVPVDDPNGSLLIHGFVDTAKAQTHSSITVDAATKAALPMISFC